MVSRGPVRLILEAPDGGWNAYVGFLPNGTVLEDHGAAKGGKLRVRVVGGTSALLLVPKNWVVKDALDTAQDALNKLKRAFDSGAGCHLTAEEVGSLGLTFLGQVWEEPDPRLPFAGPAD